MIQKGVLITIILILIVAVALLASFYLGDDETKQVIKDLAEGQASLISRFTDTTSDELQNKVVRLSDDSIVTYGIVPDNKNIAFFDENGSFNIVDYIGNVIFEGEGPQIANVRSGVWSPTKMEVIITAIDPSGVRKIFYDYQNGRLEYIDSDIQNLAFSQDGERIVYNFFDKNMYVGNISISRANGSSHVSIFKTRLSDILLDWPKEDLITFYKKSLNPRENVELFRIDNKGEGLEKILPDKKSLKVLWAPDGKSLIYSESDEDQDYLYYKFMEDGKERDLEINITVDKCAWSNTNVNIICFYDNSFYKISVLDGSRKKVYSLRGDADVKNLKFTPSGEYLLYIDNNNGYLYSLVLR